MVDVPTTEGVRDAGMTGVINGLAGGVGAALGRGILGPGIGTAAGGVTAAAMLDGNDRDIVATYAVMDGMEELFSGASASGGGGGTNERVM
jgi:hypothetical protein